MSNNWTSRRKKVDLRPPQPGSRIRRDPPPLPEKPKELRAYPTDRDTWVVVIGVALFGIAFFIITFGISEYTN
ncbi:MAG: hypothetical protein ABIQ32_04905 [Sphingomicrobium sp.]